jgi:uncharacterized protein
VLVKISYDPVKRGVTLRERGLDFADACIVFAGLQITQIDERLDYAEVRFQTYGLLNERMVMVVWIGTENDRRIISMRKCNDREQNRYREQLG